jgi:hypothetical protein
VKGQGQALGAGLRNRWLASDPARHVRQNQHFVITHDAAYLREHPSVVRGWTDAQGRVLRNGAPPTAAAHPPFVRRGRPAGGQPETCTRVVPKAGPNEASRRWRPPG